MSNPSEEANTSVPVLGTPFSVVMRCGTKRGATCTYGRSESEYMVKLEGDSHKRRLYEDWTQFDKGLDRSTKDWTVPLVIMIKGVKHNLTSDHMKRLEVVDWTQKNGLWYRREELAA